MRYHRTRVFVGHHSRFQHHRASRCQLLAQLYHARGAFNAVHQLLQQPAVGVSAEEKQGIGSPRIKFIDCGIVAKTLVVSLPPHASEYSFPQHLFQLVGLFILPKKISLRFFRLSAAAFQRQKLRLCAASSQEQ